MEGSYYPSSSSSSAPPPPSSASHRFSLTPSSASPSGSKATPTTAARIASATGLYPSPAPALPPAVGILDRPLNKGKGAEVSLSAFAFLLSEMVSYSQSRVDSVTDLEQSWIADTVSDTPPEYSTVRRKGSSSKLSQYKNSLNPKDPKREHRLIPILQFVHTQVYKYCFGRPADGLERSVEGEDEYMLTLNQPPLTQHISIPKDMAQLSCEAFTAGIVEGVLDGLDVPARVTAHTVGTEQYPQRTVILIKLDQKVMDREEVLGK